MNRVPAIEKTRLVVKADNLTGNKMFKLEITQRDLEAISRKATPTQKEVILKLSRDNGPISDKLKALSKMMKVLEETTQ